MKVTVEAGSRQNAQAIKTAMSDPSMQAFVIICGALMPLTDRQRKRVFDFVVDHLEEQRQVEAAKQANPNPERGPLTIPRGGNGEGVAAT